MSVGIKVNKLNKLLEDNQIQYSHLNYRNSNLTSINNDLNINESVLREKEKRELNLERKQQRLRYLRSLATMNGGIKDYNNTQEFEAEIENSSALMD